MFQYHYFRYKAKKIEAVMSQFPDFPGILVFLKNTKNDFQILEIHVKAK